MIVVVIIAVLAGIAIPKFQDVADSAKATTCRSNLNSLAHCLNFYACDNNGYPSVGEPHNWRGFSLLEGYLHGADGYTCPLTGSSDYRYRLYGDDDTFAVRGLYSVYPKLSHSTSSPEPQQRYWFNYIAVLCA